MDMKVRMAMCEGGRWYERILVSKEFQDVSSRTLSKNEEKGKGYIFGRNRVRRMRKAKATAPTPSA